MAKNLKFDEAVIFDKSFRTLPIFQVNQGRPDEAKELNSVVSNFSQAMERIENFLDLPAWLYALGGNTQNCKLKAHHNVFGHMKHYFAPEVFPPPQDEAEKVISEMVKEWATFNQFQANNPHLVEGEMKQSRELTNMLVGVSHTPGRTISKTQEGAEALLFSAIIQAWSAYEYLASDLWVAAVNARPAPLADNVIVFSGRADPDKGKAESQDSKKVDLRDIKGLGYDILGKMGTLLKSTKRVEFGQGYKIDQSYQMAFGNDTYEVVMKSPHRNDLMALELIRNVVVHRGTVIDKKYTEDRKHKKLSGYDYPVNTKLEPDGEFCAKFLSAVSLGGAGLVKLVYEWFCAHPTWYPPK